MKRRKLKWGRHVHSRIPNVNGKLKPMLAKCKNRRARIFDVSAGDELEVTCIPCRRIMKRAARSAGVAP